MTMQRTPLILALAAAITAPLAAGPARAAADPAADQIASFDTVLLDTMKQGPLFHRIEVSYIGPAPTP